MAGIALGLAVMLISVAVLNGFQKEIREKVVGFGSHIQISHFDSNNSYELSPVLMEDETIEQLKQIEGIKQVNGFAVKAGIIKTNDQMHGVVLKGVGDDFNWDFFKDRIIEGRPPLLNDTANSNDILISRKIADLMNYKTGDDVRMYFIIDNQIRGRKFSISGIYETGLTEFDEMYVLGDIRHIQRLNQWSGGEVSGYEVLIDDFENLDKTALEVYSVIDYDLDAQTIQQLYPQIFDWIQIQDLNVVIILVLMSLVSGITIISTLLILILEHTNDIGILKAMGTSNLKIRKIFMYATLYIAFYGLLWGNLFAGLLLWLQKSFGLIPLPEDSYFLSQVPVSITAWDFVLLNSAVIIVCFVMMLIPSLVIRYISPIKAIRYE
jgi:lipoprotein-releasing system permease protein